MSTLHNLSLKEKQLMFSFIELHINLKNIVPSDIEYNNNEILSIKELKFNKHQRKFFTPPEFQSDKKNLIIIKKPAIRIQNSFLKLLNIYIRE